MKWNKLYTTSCNYFCSLLQFFMFRCIYGQCIMLYTKKKYKMWVYFSGPGISGCTHFGYINKGCGFPEVDPSCLPEACTSIIYDGVYVDLSYHVFGDPCTCTDNKIIMGNITSITKINIYI